MELLSAKLTFMATDEFIPKAIRAVKAHFEGKGFTYKTRRESFNVTSFEIQRGNILDQTLGLKSGAVVIFTRHGGSTDVEVRGCVLRNQVAGPALLLRFVPHLRVPLAITGAFGIAMQAKLPAEVMDVVRQAYARHAGEPVMYCPYCGAEMPGTDAECRCCGRTACTGVIV